MKLKERFPLRTLHRGLRGGHGLTAFRVFFAGHVSAASGNVSGKTDRETYVHTIASCFMRKLVISKFLSYAKSILV